MHLSPSHDVRPLGETGQVTHAVPQALTLAASTQIPLQGFFPTGHLPSHAALSSMHVSMQGFLPAGHSIPHLTPSHVLVPPAAVGQLSHASPQ
jgi:hypothetical protein